MEEKFEKRFSYHKGLAPTAAGRGQYSVRTRLVHVRDGIGDCITMLPTSATEVQKYLQYAWARVDYMISQLEPEEPPPCLGL